MTSSALVLDASSNPLPGVHGRCSRRRRDAERDDGDLRRERRGAHDAEHDTDVDGDARRPAPRSGEVHGHRLDAHRRHDRPRRRPARSACRCAITVTLSPAAPAATSPRQVESLVVDFGDGTIETRDQRHRPVGFTHTYQQRAAASRSRRRRPTSAGNTGIASTAIVVDHAPLPTVHCHGVAESGAAADQRLTTITVDCSDRQPDRPDT